jgi:hypothetical protein
MVETCVEFCRGGKVSNNPLLLVPVTVLFAHLTTMRVHRVSVLNARLISRTFPRALVSWKKAFGLIRTSF